MSMHVKRANLSSKRTTTASHLCDYKLALRPYDWGVLRFGHEMDHFVDFILLNFVVLGEGTIASESNQISVLVLVERTNLAQF